MAIEFDDRFDMAEIEQQQTSQEQVTEATQFRTVPTGTYVIRAKRVQFREADEQSPWPGRRVARVTAEVLDFDTREPLGVTVFFSASPDVVRKPDSRGRERMDPPSVLWGQAAKAFGLRILDVLNGLDQFPMVARIREVFVKLDGSMVGIQADAKSSMYEEERRELVQKGATPKNFVDSLRPLEP